MFARARLIVIVLIALFAAVLPLAQAQSGGGNGLPVEFSGTVFAISGTTIVVNDQTVDVSQVTLPAPLRLGDQVGIRGHLLEDGRILATSLVILTSGQILTPVPTLVLTPTPQLGSQGICPRTAAYWAEAGDWPAGSLMLGVESYSRETLMMLLESGSESDASLRLARQLIAAKLNVAAGATTAPIGETILQADLLLSQQMGRLPFGILPTAAAGPAMITYAELLDSYNRSLVTPYCRPADQNDDSDDDDDDDNEPDTPQIVIIEGPVSSVNGNIIRIYDFNVLVQPRNPLLARLEVGDVIRVNGTLERRSDVTMLVAINITEVRGGPRGDDRSGSRHHDESSGSRHDDGSGHRCDNPPPPHAPAHGWRWQCEGGPHPGNANGNGNGRGN